MWLVDSFFKKLNIPKLSEEQRTSCEGLITTENVRRQSKYSRMVKHQEMMEYLLNFVRILWDILADEL